MDLRKIILGVLRQGMRAVGRLLSTIPAGWLVVMGIVSFPIAVLSVVVAFVFFILLVLLGILFYLLVWRPAFGSRRKPEKVIEAEYTVRSEDDK